MEIEIAAIMPEPDVTLKIVIDIREHLQPSVTQALPTSESRDQVSDKYRQMKLAPEGSPKIPKTIIVLGGTMAAVLDQISASPVVVGPGRFLLKVGERWVMNVRTLYPHVEALVELYLTKSYLNSPSLSQQ